MESLEILEAPVAKERSEGCGGSSDEDSMQAKSDVMELQGRQIADWLSRMALTQDRFLRATPAHRVIAHISCGLLCGARLEPNFSFAHSREVKEISKFISHSWHGSQVLKILTLQLFYNGKVAMLVSNVVALLAAVLSSLGLLPGLIERIPRFGTEPILVGPWSLSMGLLSFLLVWIFWAPQELVFCDRLCIDQEDPAEKGEGVLNIGACLKQSKKILVIWDETYCQRLWCQFELAAFLKTHADGNLVVQPTSLSIFFVGVFLQNVLTWYCSFLLPDDSVFTPPIFILLTIFHASITATVAFRYTKSLDMTKSQLQNFSFADAKCFCCSVDHKGPAGERMLCDREIMRKCVQHWFGSVDDFDTSVQTRVRDALTKELGGHFCPRFLLIAQALPLFWSQMDWGAARFLQQDASVAITVVILVGFGAMLFAPPLVVGLVFVVIRYTPPSCRFPRLLAGLACVGSNLITQLLLQVCFVFFEEWTATGLYLAVLSLSSMLIWSFARRLYKS